MIRCKSQSTHHRLLLHLFLLLLFLIFLNYSFLVIIVSPRYYLWHSSSIHGALHYLCVFVCGERAHLRCAMYVPSVCLRPCVFVQSYFMVKQRDANNTPRDERASDERGTIASARPHST